MARLWSSSVAFIVLLVLQVVLSRAQAWEGQNSTFDEDAWGVDVDKPATRLHELYSLTRPMNAADLPDTLQSDGNEECLEAVKLWIDGNYTNGAAVRPFLAPLFTF